MTVTIEGANLKSLISNNGYTTNNVTFKLSGDNSMNYDGSNSYISMGTVSKTAKNFSIVLSVPANYTIEKIKSASVRATGYTGAAWDNISLTIDGGSKTNIRTIAINPQNSDNNYTTVTSSSISSKSTVGMSFTSSANDKLIYIRKVVIDLEVSTYYDYSATAIPNNDAYGNTTTEVTTENTSGSLSSVPVSNTATFTANPNSGYALVGWGTSANATTYESTDNPYQTSITNSTPGSTADKTLYAIFKHLPMFYFAANSPNVTGGTATANVESASVMGGTLAQTSATTTATFRATPQSGYEFQGWGTSQSASTYESTDNPYTATLTNNIAESEVAKTLYAIFKPVFNFSASATSSNGSLGTATASVANKIIGDVNATQAQTTATFTANPENDCLFKGWYENDSYSGSPVSTNTTYEVTLINSEIGSTASKTLYALFKKKQNLQWVDAELDLNLVNGHNYSTAATVTSGKTITYTSDDHNAVTIDAEGTIHAVGLGDARVTASVPGDDIYQPEAIERVFSVGEIKQATFTPAWGEGTSTDIKVDGSTSIGLLNIANDETFTITVGTQGIINVSRDGNTLNIDAVSAGTTTLKLTQTGNEQLAGNEVTYTITVSKYPNTFTLAAENKAMKVEEEWSDVITDQGNNNTLPSYSKEGIVSFDNNKITALAEGSTVITFTQAATDRNEGITKTINVTVTKIANTLNVTLANTEVDVDGTINLVVSGLVSNGAKHADITDMLLSSAVNNGTAVITYANDIITACNAGTAKIKFVQDATAKYTAYESETYTITVSKISNAITVTLDDEQKSSKNIGRGDRVALAYTSPSDGEYSINRTSGSDDIATISGNTITPGNTDGTNIWEITQAETYKYSAATATVRIKVNSVAEDEGYVFVGYTGQEENSVEFELSGPGKDIYLGARKSGVGNTTIQVRASTSDSWITVKEFDTKYSLSGCEPYSFFDIIPEDARYVRIYGSGSIHHFTDVKVTRKTYVRAAASQTNLGEVYTDKTASATFNVSYSTTNGGDIEILSNNPRFTVNQHPITVSSNSDNVSDPVVVTVTYTPDPGYLGDDEGTITISDRYYSAELTFTATAKKYETAIGRGSNTATETTVDGTINNAFAFTGTSAATPSADSNESFYYAISSTYGSDVHTDEGVISYDPATNTITGRNAGTAKLTIYQKSTDKLSATSETFDFSVSKLANPVNIALSTNTTNVDGEIGLDITDDNGKGAFSVNFSNVSYANVSQNREGDFMSYDSEKKTLTGMNAGSGTVTVTQAETYKYLAKSNQFNVTVNKLEQTLVWDREVETSLQIGTVVEGNTAHSEQELTPVTYASGNSAAIQIDAQSGRLTANAVGSNITITASQAGNYKYAAKSITRQFSVFNKQTPTFTPEEGKYDFQTGTITVGWEGTTTIAISGVGENSDAGFTYSGHDSSVISVVRGGEENGILTISGLKIGSTTLTLTQTASDDFIGKTATYTINVVMPDDYLTLDPSTGFDLAEGGKYRKVFLKRTIPAGLNTIALPFNTTASALGAQNAYSFVNVGVIDGAYYFYFKELAADATLLAGVPYVISCNSDIINKELYNINVLSAEELQSAGSVDCGQWSFVANLSAGDDGSGIDMNGKYGVVNSVDQGEQKNKIMLGGSGSKLKAYTAYFVLNQASLSSYPAAAPASTKAAGSAVAPSAAGSSAAVDLPANAIPLFTVKE